MRLYLEDDTIRDFRVASASGLEEAQVSDIIKEYRAEKRARVKVLEVRF